MRILLTGASGFIGSHFRAEVKGHQLVFVGRSRPDKVSPHSFIQVDLESEFDLKDVLKDIDVVIHCAARAHVMHESTVDPIEAYMRCNYVPTKRLAMQASEMGVKRFVFISTIKVNGEVSSLASPFTAWDAPEPMGPYALSKYKAEKFLFELSRSASIETVVIRPPLVYGKGVKGNFLSLIKLLKLQLPLPLGGVKNNRSMIGARNLVDLIMRCASHQQAANHVFLASDNEVLSTPELLRKLARVLKVKSIIIPCPSAFILFLARLLGKEQHANRIVGSLVVDVTDTKQLLSWEPPYSVDDELEQIVK